MIFLFVLLHLNNVYCTFNIFTPIVSVEQGQLRGLRSLSGQNRYYGIPYATSRRFELPKKPPKWRGVFDAVHRFGSCSQAVSLLRFGTEDCLELDVYSPQGAKPGHKLPVMMFIHGGAYYYGSKWHYDAEFLVEKNVVVVVINYRVGVLGFLCLNNTANLGLKDQVAALKWIKNNIAAFGGDPDNVTISGQSAGASAAGMHMLSKSSEGLFHKAILISGTPLAPWAFNHESKKPAFEDAEKFRKVTNEQEVYEVFKTANIVDLLNNCGDTSINPRYFKYSPCIDSNFSNPFFHDTPRDTIVSGNFNKVPIISGFMDVEGMLFYGLNNDRTFADFEENFNQKLPSIFSQSSPEVKKVIEGKLRSYYFMNKTITKDAVQGVVNFYSDWMAYSTADAFSKLMVKYSDQPVYSYIFSYLGNRNFAKALFGYKSRLKGASHSDDIFYIFKPGGVPMVLSKPDRMFIDRITTLLTNFMKYGNPTPTPTKLVPVRWPPVTSNSSSTMSLDRELRVTDLTSHYKGEFFLDLLCRYGLDGYVPCD
ncbi:esterase E4-like [Bombyx mandarina]|uniref:Carboxylic ester hydrolase n=1 Tax=Bombyx mandarina TaxID=7092 RepID=A0A6J2JNT2_BOMMA|nr:esterase E4-like [Bombyx mandarina]